MKATILTILALIVLAGCNQAQTKKKIKPVWKLSGFQSWGIATDSIIEYYDHIYKDSSASVLKSSACQCSVFTVRNNNGKIDKMPCDSLVKRHYEELHYSFRYEVKKVKGVVIEKSEPKYTQTWGMGRNDDFEYYYNNRRVWPLEFFKQPID